MISIVHLLFYAMMYLTRIAGIETRNHEYSNRYPRMYLTRVAGIETLNIIKSSLDFYDVSYPRCGN